MTAGNDQAPPSLNDQQALEELEFRLTTILPAEYQACYEDVQPVSMGSAGLKYGDDGRVAWNEMWASFCDLAMAGGPPHKGTLLQPGRRTDIEAQPERYDAVVREIARGITMVCDLPVDPFASPGWVRLQCHGPAMAGWLLRAIVMENVSARVHDAALDLPAGPDFRIEKEIKNVITVVAKTSHYWGSHMWRPERHAIDELFVQMAEESPLLEPSDDGDRGFAAAAEKVRRATGLPASNHRYPGWLGLECPGVHAAVWMMRMLVAANVLSRREETVLFVPVNPAIDPDAGIVSGTVELIHRLAASKGVI